MHIFPLYQWNIYEVYFYGHKKNLNESGRKKLFYSFYFVIPVVKQETDNEV